MPRVTGTLHGPYARQVFPGRLKYWFALIDDDERTSRYEVIFDREFRTGKARLRPDYPDGVPKYGCAFRDHTVPPLLAPYPSAPLYAGRKLVDAVRTLLSDEERADIVRLTLTGETPRNHAPEGDLL